MEKDPIPFDDICLRDYVNFVFCVVVQSAAVCRELFCFGLSKRHVEFVYNK